MYNSGKIIIGILIFLGLFTFPLWFNKGRAVEPPKLELPKKEKKCVEATNYMRSSHMELLNTWRDSVVREGNRVYVNAEGKKFDMSLQNTCMKCHTSRAKFCDRCHNYLNEAPPCWECHIQPDLKLPGRSE